MFRAETTGSSRSFAPANRVVAPRRKNTAFVRGGFSLIAALADFCTILASGALVKLLFWPAGANVAAMGDVHIRLELLVGVLLILVNATRSEYSLSKYLTFENQVGRSVSPWCLSVFGALVLSLSVKPLATYDAFALATLFIGGFGAINLTRLCLTYGVRARAKTGRLAVRRIFLLSYEQEMEAFAKRHDPWLLGTDVVAAAVLRGPENLGEDLALALASARILEPDDVFILVPWSSKAVIDAAIHAFLRIPAAIHLGPERLLDRFSDARIAKSGQVSSLNLVRDPLKSAEVIAKRLFDIVFASAGLILLLPLYIIVAIAIKLDSPGPVIFRQRRYGFNQQPFRIFKFRSMSTLEDDSNLVLVKRGYPRATRVGSFMRRHNIDELPQLFNVLPAEMSLVGPRPHAVVMDQMFERRIALYARRHNVKPGTTGWAQVNGCRGGMGEERIRARVEHDLYYIDNWSMWFDIEILWLTLASKKAYFNAF
jgi:exopolysaccharide biosynthesis polyprenyl glycosylphosphotransferase